MTYRAQTLAIQRAVNQLGFDAGPEDGLFGAKTASGVDAWKDAKGEPKPVPATAPSPVTGLKRIVWHWSAGTYDWTGLSAEHYHFGVDGNGGVHAGEHEPEDNISTSDGDYAAHVSGFNTGCIGLSMMGMGDATTSGTSINWGRWPIREVQVDAMLRKTAELCRRYGIAPSRQTTLSHAEVWETFGIWQKGKWDIRCLPGWSNIKTAVETGDILRSRLATLLA